MPSGIVAGAGIPKDQVNYRQHEKCATCTHFYPLNSCDLVSGNISPEAVCNRWEIKPASDGGKDATFYQQEYNKVSGADIHLKNMK